MQISLARHEQANVDQFVREVLRHPEVLECFATSGEADFHLRVVVEVENAVLEAGFRGKGLDGGPVAARQYRRHAARQRLCDD